jgi:HEAT repeat protein
MPKRDVEAVVERIGKLRDVTHAEAVAGLRTALLDRVNLVVAKAARVVAERQLRELIPELLASFDRLFVNPVERDTQCWAKNAIAKALTELDYRASAPFLRGCKHEQKEAVWGGQEDTAQTLRSICFLGLASCNDIPRNQILRLLVDAMADEAAVVRVEAVRALTEMEGEEAILVLRLKARVGDRDLSVTGQVFDSLLRLDPETSLPMMAEFLDGAEDVKEEAALALGSSRLPAAMEILINVWPRASDPYFRRTVLRALSASRQEKAIEFLLGLIREGVNADAEGAAEALGLHKDSAEIQAAMDAALKDRGRSTS